MISFTNKIYNAVMAWEKAINEALYNGKGKYVKWYFVHDLYDYKKIINYMYDDQYKRVANIAINMDTDAREHIPSTIYNFLESVYNE